MKPVPINNKKIGLSSPISIYQPVQETCANLVKHKTEAKEKSNLKIK